MSDPHEIESELRVYLVKRSCSECGSGFMKSTGIVHTSIPPKYPSECDSCGYKEVFLVSYPTKRFRPV